MHYNLQKQEVTIVATITACHKVQAQLDQYQMTLAGWVNQQQQQSLFAGGPEQACQGTCA